MIPNITRGSRMAGLLLYLASTDADKTRNAHTDPHLVAGDAAVMAWYDDGVLDAGDAMAIAKHLDQPRRKFGVDVWAKDLRWDPVLKKRVDHGYKRADVWHCSLSLRAEEGGLTDQQWGDIANEFVDAMGFTEASGKAQCRWAAINHGTSENGNHHIHIAVSLVREDGTKASTHNDYHRAQKTCRELEQKYGLEQLSSVHAARGYDRADVATARRQEREMYRASLSRKVRASATAAGTEAEFIRRVRDTGLLVRPRYAKNTTDVIVGYSVAERPQAGERPIWYGGGKLAKDLGLGQLRGQWTDTPQAAMEAAAEWNAAARGRRKANSRGPETRRPDAQLWAKYTRETAALADRLRTVPLDDHATWARAAREASGVFAAWSHRLETTPGPLAATAAELSRTAQLKEPKLHGTPAALPSIAGTAMLLLAAAGKDKTAAQTALLVQLMRTARAVYDMHRQSGRLRESQHLHRVLTTELADFARTMPALQPATAAGQPQHAQRTVGAAAVPTAIEIARNDQGPAPQAGPVRPGSVVPNDIDPRRTTHTAATQAAGPQADRGHGR